MAGQPPLPVGTFGRILTTRISPDGAKPEVWQASCRFRDADGVTRKVKRTGRSRTAAENALKAALAQRQHGEQGVALTPESRVRVAGEEWLRRQAEKVEAGDRSHTTLAVYRSVWANHVAPHLGGLRLREVTVARCEAWQVALRREQGAARTKTARTVLSGVLGYAARMGALRSNPCRDLSPIPGGRRRPPRAMTREERAAWLAAMEDVDTVREQLAAAQAAGDLDAVAVWSRRLLVVEKTRRWDIPDLTRLMLATGCRIGEALALSWDEIDFDAGTVAVRWHLVRVKGESLHRVSGAKSDAGVRLLRVPRWCVDMLMQRRVDPRSGYPVFPDVLGGWRDPSNVLRVLREGRDATGFGWVTSHVLRKTTLTVLDEAGFTPRQLADAAGHADPSMTMRVYMGRGVANEAMADALEDLL